MSTERSPLLGPRRGGNERDAESQGGEPDVGNDNVNDVSIHSTVVPLADEPSTGSLALILGGAWIGSFLAALDTTIVVTLAASISASFNSLSLLAWLASAYFIANAAIQPIAGRLTDIFSRRTGLILSNIFFALGNLICGLAQDEGTMILGRVVAGLGGGGLTAISTMVASDLVPLRRRGVWQGIGNIVYGAGAGTGAILGGWINDVWGWRKAFLIMIPLTLVSGTMCFFFINIPVKYSDKSALRRVDFLGATTLVSTLTLLLLGLNSGGSIVPWNHPLIYGTLSASAILLLVFVYVEARYASEPVIPVTLLLNRTVMAGCLTNWFTSMVIFSILFYGPIYFQVRGLSATEAGARMVPQSVGTAIGSVSTGLIMRTTGRYYYLSAAIQLIFVSATAILAFFNLATPLWLPIVAFLLAGLGYSGMLTVTLLALISAVEHQHQAVVTSASYAFRSTGSAIGVTISSAVFQNLLTQNLWARLHRLPDAADIIERLKGSLEVIKQLPRELRQEVRYAYMDSLRGVFATLLGISILAALMSLAMREHTLYSSLSRK